MKYLLAQKTDSVVDDKDGPCDDKSTHTIFDVKNSQVEK